MLTRQPKRTTLLLGVLLGVGALAGCGKVVEAGPGAGESPDFEDVVVTEPPTTSGPEGEIAAGACITTTEGTEADDPGYRIVDCADEHLAELAGSLDVSDLFGAEAEHPTSDDLEPVRVRCEPVVRDYLTEGASAFPEVALLALAPSVSAWASGDRMVWCAVGVVSEGELQPYTGRLADGTAA